LSGAPEPKPRKVLYCHCAYAKVVKPDVKEAVLADLGRSGRDFDAVPDLCELAARKDEALGRIAAEADLTIVACFPRAVRWLFHAGGHTLPDETTIRNMRTESPEEIAQRLDEPAEAESAETDTDASEAPPRAHDETPERTRT